MPLGQGCAYPLRASDATGPVAQLQGAVGHQGREGESTRAPTESGPGEQGRESVTGTACALIVAAQSVSVCAERVAAAHLG